MQKVWSLVHIQVMGQECYECAASVPEKKKVGRFAQL